ncbi:MAG: malate dehydrogenase [Candidatus Auribacterota bacterium]|nr:malate dehydrogenase [Candidatus Auribacterota bacterium]
MRNKIAVIGSGFVGATTAQRLAEKDLGDVVLVDILDGIPQGKALDMYESAAIELFSSRVQGTNDYSDIAGSDIVVVTAGLARKPGMTREDLLLKNAQIIESICREIVRNAPDAIVIMVTNPLDIMTRYALHITQFPLQRVIGMAGVLDAARMCAFIAMELDVSPVDVNAMVLGGHGDAMVPLARYTTVSGIPITELLDETAIEQINNRTRDGGAEIVKLLKTGSAYYAPSSGAVKMVEAILMDSRRIMPCSALLNGQYGLDNVCIGVPVKLGRDGVLDIIELNLTGEERASLHASAKVVSDNFNVLIKR